MTAEWDYKDKRGWKWDYKILCDMSPSGGTRVHTLYRGHERLAQGDSMAHKEGIVPWGKEVSLMHCTGLRWGAHSNRGRESRGAKKGKVTQKNATRLEPWNRILDF